jgi:hypothetical protein
LEVANDRNFCGVVLSPSASSAFLKPLAESIVQRNIQFFREFESKAFGVVVVWTFENEQIRAAISGALKAHHKAIVVFGVASYFVERYNLYLIGVEIQDYLFVTVKLYPLACFPPEAQLVVSYFVLVSIDLNSLDVDNKQDENGQKWRSNWEDKEVFENCKSNNE